jgi:hypothetical protein
MRQSPPGGIMDVTDLLEKNASSQGGDASVSEAQENNKALVRRFVEEVYNRGNLDAVDELLAPDYVDHTEPSGKYAGREGLKRGVAKQRAF